MPKMLRAIFPSLATKRSEFLTFLGLKIIKNRVKNIREIMTIPTIIYLKYFSIEVYLSTKGGRTSTMAGAE